MCNFSLSTVAVSRNVSHLISFWWERNQQFPPPLPPANRPYVCRYRQRNTWIRRTYICCKPGYPRAPVSAPVQLVLSRIFRLFSFADFYGNFVCLKMWQHKNLLEWEFLNRLTQLTFSRMLVEVNSVRWLLQKRWFPQSFLRIDRVYVCFTWQIDGGRESLDREQNNHAKVEKKKNIEEKCRLF